MAEREILVRVLGDSKDYDRMMDRLGKKSSGLGRSLKTLGKVGIPVVGGALAGLGIAIKNGFDELSEAQKVTAQTNAVLKSTGGVANITAKRVGALADSLSRMTGIDDEAVQATENLLLTFTKIRNQTGKNNKIFDQATKVALDMSVALGQDTKSSAIQLGKALNDPIKGVTALQRVGVSFTAAQKDQIEALVESGRMLEAQKFILKELQVEFGGSAKAAGDTFAGSLAKLRNAFDGVTAALAKGMLPVVRKVADALAEKFADPEFMARVERLGRLLTENVVEAFTAIGEWFRRHWGSIQSGFKTTVDIVKALRTGIVGVKDVLMALADVGGQVFRVLLVPMRLLLTIVSAIISVFAKLPFIGGKFASALEAINTARGGLASVDAFLASLGEGIPNANRRARGGPVSAGQSYLVGERGPEMFVPGRSGQIVPGGGPSVVNIWLDGQLIERQVTSRQTRHGRSAASSRRGRYGGISPAIG